MDERRLFARQVLERKGHRFDRPPALAAAKEYLLESVARVASEQRHHFEELQTIRTRGDASEEFAARSRLFRTHGAVEQRVARAS